MTTENYGPVMNRKLKRGSLLLFRVVGLLIVATTTRVFPQQWEYLGLPGEIITAIAVQSRDTVYASTLGAIFKTTNGGATWDTLLPNTYVYVLDLKMHPANPEVLYAALGNSSPPFGVLKTTNGGMTWFHADSGIFVDWETSAQVIEFDPVSPETMYVGTAGFFGGNLYKSTNGGSSWTLLGVNDTSRLREGVISITVNPTSINIIYAGTPQNGDLLKSTDGGVTWALTGLHDVSGVVDVKIDSIDTQLLYACSGTIRRSSDGGVSWESIYSGLPSQSNSMSLAIDQITRKVYVGLYAISSDSGGVFQSNDLGLSWQRTPGLFLTNNIRTITLSPTYDQIYAGVNDSGIYRANIVTGIDDRKNSTPLYTMLMQNYPNPFNPTTTLDYELPKAADVTIKVFDVLGREVRVLVHDHKAAGRYSVIFDAQGLSSGVYFYRLTTSTGFTSIKKFVLIR